MAETWEQRHEMAERREHRGGRRHRRNRELEHEPVARRFATDERRESHDHAKERIDAFRSHEDIHALHEALTALNTRVEGVDTKVHLLDEHATGLHNEIATDLAIAELSTHEMGRDIIHHFAKTCAHGIRQDVYLTHARAEEIAHKVEAAETTDALHAELQLWHNERMSFGSRIKAGAGPLVVGGLGVILGNSNLLTASPDTRLGLVILILAAYFGGRGVGDWVAALSLPSAEQLGSFFGIPTAAAFWGATPLTGSGLSMLPGFGSAAGNTTASLQVSALPRPLTPANNTTVTLNDLAFFTLANPSGCSAIMTPPPAVPLGGNSGGMGGNAPQLVFAPTPLSTPLTSGTPYRWSADLVVGNPGASTCTHTTLTGRYTPQ